MPFRMVRMPTDSAPSRRRCLVTITPSSPGSVSPSMPTVWTSRYSEPKHYRRCCALQGRLRTRTVGAACHYEAVEPASVVRSNNAQSITPLTEPLDLADDHEIGQHGNQRIRPDENESAVERSREGDDIADG